MKKLAAVLFLLPTLAFAQAPANVAASPVLTLEQAIEKAMAANPSLAAGRQNVLAAEAKVDQSWTGFLPQLLLSVGYRRSTMNSAAPPYLNLSALPPGMGSLGSLMGRKEPDTYDNLSAGLTLNQTLWDFGKTTGGMKAAKQLHVAASEDFTTAREQMKLNTVIAYYLVLAADETVRVSEETLRQRTKHLEVAKAQAEVGTRQRIDVTRAQADFVSAQVNLSRARNGQKTTRVNLATLMGGDALEGVLLARPGATPLPELSDIPALIEEALSRRAELRALGARIEAGEAGVTSIRSGYYPNLAFQAGLSYQGYKFDSLPYNYFVGLSLNWNMLAPIPIKAASREAQANVHALRLSHENLILGIRAEVESAALALQEAQERLEPAAALVTTALETLQLAEGRYEAGAGGIVELTDAQTLVVQAQLGLIQAEFDLETARARLMKAMGSFVN